MEMLDISFLSIKLVLCPVWILGSGAGLNFSVGVFPYNFGRNCKHPISEFEFERSYDKFDKPTCSLQLNIWSIQSELKSNIQKLPLYYVLV